MAMIAATMAVVISVARFGDVRVNSSDDEIGNFLTNQDCPAALNFCDEDEAMRFSAAIRENISRRERKKAGVCL